MSFNFTRVVGTQAQTRKTTRLDTEVRVLTLGSNEEREGKEKREMERDPAARPATVGVCRGSFPIITVSQPWGSACSDPGEWA